MRGILADAGKFLHLRNRFRELAIMAIHDELGGGMKVSRSGVIAEALPRMKN